MTPEHSSRSDLFVSPDIHYSEMETAHPRLILEWAADTIDRLAVATSFQSSGLVILHLMRAIRPDIPVLFIDTGFHFDETLQFKRQITDTWHLKVVDLRGAHGSAKEQERLYGPRLYERDPDRCCFMNKVAPLREALEEYDGWISGLRRDQSPLRAETPIVEAQMLQSGKEILKLHPLAHWSKADVGDYVTEHGIPTHPLLEKGFVSIGCSPCTSPVALGDDDRAGRWNGLAKSECGIHTFGQPHGPVQTEAEQ